MVSVYHENYRKLCVYENLIKLIGFMRNDEMESIAVLHNTKMNESMSDFLGVDLRKRETLFTLVIHLRQKCGKFLHTLQLLNLNWKFVLSVPLDLKSFYSDMCMRLKFQIRRIIESISSKENKLQNSKIRHVQAPERRTGDSTRIFCV